MCLALNMANMAKRGISLAAMEEMQQLIKKPHAEVQGENMWGVECPRHIKVKAVIE
jgi:hypothetical protein